MTTIQHFHFSAIATAILNVLLVGWVLVSAPALELKKRFLWYSSAIVVWSFFLWLFSSSHVKEDSYLFCQLLHAGSIFIPCFFLHFVFSYLDLRGRGHRNILLFVYLTSAFFWILDIFFPRFFISDVIPKLGFHYFMEPGLFYHAWMVFFFIVVIYGHIVLLRGVVTVERQVRRQRLFFLIGNAIGYFGGIGSFLPVYNITIFPYPYGTYGVAFFSFVTAYTIIKFRFLDIEVIIKKTLVLAGLFAMVMAVVGAVTTVTQSLIGRYFQVATSVTTAISVLIAIALYDPAKKILIYLTDRYLFQRKINYRTLLKEASEYLAHVSSLKRQTRNIVAFLLKKARITNASIYSFQNQAPGSLLLQASRPPMLARGHKTILLSHPLIQHMRRHRGPVDLAQIQEARNQTKNASTAEEYDQIIKILNEHHAEAVIPCFGGDAAERARKTELHLRGVLFLGHQKSDEPYSNEDLDVFFTLGQESSIAFENARLYDEAVERAYELETTNQQLNDAQTKLVRALSETEMANEKLKVTQASLIVAEKNATMVGMAKAIGHEIYNPLSTVMYRLGTINKEKVKKCHELIEKNGKMMNGEDLKQFKKLLAGIDDDSRRAVTSAKRIDAVVHTLTNILKDTKGEIGPLSLIVLCREAIEATRFSTYEENMGGCDMTEKVAANILIQGNLEQLLQVFVNLIKNAYEAMIGRKNREIVIEGDIDPEDPRMAKITVSDNGPGIPADVLPKIWLQGFSTKTRKDDSIGAAGQGQGLFICKHVIESVHKGTISCESVVGKGTTFIIRLPLAEEREQDERAVS